MLNTKEINSLLEEGKALQTEIASFIKLPNSSCSQRLIARIDKLIAAIKPQLLNPSPNEDNEIRLVIANLGRIVKNLNDIKHTLKIN